MKKPLDKLIEEAGVKERERISTGKRPAPPNRNVPKPLIRAEGEPPLIAQPVVPGARDANGYRGRQLSMLQRDERYRKFARELFFGGFDQRAAYLATGYSASDKNMAEQISNLLKQDVVIDELNRLGKVARETLEAEAVDCVKLWKEIAEANVFDYFEQNGSVRQVYTFGPQIAQPVTDGDGTLRIKGNIKDLPLDKQRAVKKIKVRKEIRRYGSGEDATEVETIDTEVELWDRISAIRSIAQVQGLFREEDKDVIRDFAALLASRLDRYRERVGKTYNQDGQEV